MSLDKVMQTINVAEGAGVNLSYDQLRGQFPDIDPAILLAALNKNTGKEKADAGVVVVDTNAKAEVLNHTGTGKSIFGAAIEKETEKTV